MLASLQPNPPGKRTPRTIPKLLTILGSSALVLAVAIQTTACSGFPPAEPTATVAPTPPPVTQAPSPIPPARLALDSQPEGATVSVDGIERGKTPLLVDNLRSGDHQVSFSLADRQLYGTSVFLSPAETRNLSIDLPPTPVPTSTTPPIPTGPFYPLAVMVENMVDARPQSGLARADIVYEALVEGGITRFLAIYTDGKADAIGPVRSARHYFVYLAAEYGASYVHIGWSPQAYGALQATGITDLDEIRGDPGFWRVDTRLAPHNAYTSTDLLRSTLEKVRRVAPGSLAGFRFRTDPAPIQGPEARKISIQYAPDYRVDYQYSPEERMYLRSMDGVPHKDAETGEQVAPQNLVIQFVNSWVIDNVGRLDMTQVGKGKALYFRNGVVTEGSWQKASLGDVTEWYDAEGQPVQMNPGKTWVQIVPPGTPIEY